MVDRNNTIAGWVLAAFIAALGSSILFGKLMHGEVPGEGKQGYVIQGVESGEGGAAAAVPLGNMMATADMTKGEGIFKKCVACHTIAAGGASGIGPNLHGILGKGLGAQGGFAYSDALKAKGGSWTFEAMDEWLANPKKYVPGTKMTFAGLGNGEERAALLLYLNSQGSNLPLPSPVEAAVADAAAAEAAPAADAKTAGEAAPAAAPAEGAAK